MQSGYTGAELQLCKKRADIFTLICAESLSLE